MTSAVSVSPTALDTHACMHGTGDDGVCPITNNPISLSADVDAGDGASATIARPEHARMRLEGGVWYTHSAAHDHPAVRCCDQH